MCTSVFWVDTSTPGCLLKAMGRRCGCGGGATKLFESRQPCSQVELLPVVMLGVSILILDSRLCRSRHLGECDRPPTSQRLALRALPVDALLTSRSTSSTTLDSPLDTPVCKLEVSGPFASKRRIGCVWTQGQPPRPCVRHAQRTSSSRAAAAAAAASAASAAEC
eukprot:TRINITY_DN11344_c0_g1_i1.p1 TRINITY_DN11344_c0_g1~~TRINITY_DN11344_c0_g1_i1.p1  ORF type:complete len:165 (+),score=8.08 TRINITY_DN11344_c0_g1_i1:90-584(+)